MIDTEKAFKSLVVRENSEGFVSAIENKTLKDLPDNDACIKVHYSSLNYKDALSASGNKGITKKYPHTPGIDASGVVYNSNTSFNEGEEVLVTGYDLGMNTSGGFQEFIRVPTEWVVKLPSNLSLREAMIYGTAGFTAAQSVYEFIRNEVTPDKGKILVTGATGGVGSMAVALLAHLKYEVTALTRKKEQHDFLKKIGAKEIVDTNSYSDESSAPLLKQKWAGVVDTVGGSLLSKTIRETYYNGCVTCCGMIGSDKIDTSIFPFILRGVKLIGINSERCSYNTREVLWNHMANDWKPPCLETIFHLVSLEQLPHEIEKILQGNQVGRTVLSLIQNN